MIRTCGTCAFMLDDGDNAPYCAIRDLYYSVTEETLDCKEWRSKENKLCVGLARYHADINRMLNRG